MGEKKQKKAAAEAARTTPTATLEVPSKKKTTAPPSTRPTPGGSTKETPPTHDPKDPKDPNDPKEQPPLVAVNPKVSQPRPGKVRYTPFIVERYTEGDTGARPIPGGTPFWRSPDVFVRSSAGHNVPVAGEKNRIFCRVNNWGMQDASGVRLRFWWANPSLAINESTAHLIGVASAFVPARYSVIVECESPWVPVMENNGHECVFAEAWVPESDPLQHALEPVTDRHVCQKNLNVIEVPLASAMSFPLQALNVARTPQQVTFGIQALPAATALRLLSSPAVQYRGKATAAKTRLPFKLEIAPEGTFVAGPSATYAQRAVAYEAAVAKGEGKDCQPAGAQLQTVTLGGLEMRTVTLRAQLPPEAAVGEAFAFDVWQNIGGMTVGGYTVLAVVVPRKK